MLGQKMRHFFHHPSHLPMKSCCAAPAGVDTDAHNLLLCGFVFHMQLTLLDAVVCASAQHDRTVPCKTHLPLPAMPSLGTAGNSGSGKPANNITTSTLHAHLNFGHTTLHAHLNFTHTSQLFTRTSQLYAHISTLHTTLHTHFNLTHTHISTLHTHHHYHCHIHTELETEGHKKTVNNTDDQLYTTLELHTIINIAVS